MQTLVPPEELVIPLILKESHYLKQCLADLPPTALFLLTNKKYSIETGAQHNESANQRMNNKSIVKFMQINYPRGWQRKKSEKSFWFFGDFFIFGDFFYFFDYFDYFQISYILTYISTYFIRKYTAVMFIIISIHPYIRN